jgi:hypothetical protein
MGTSGLMSGEGKPPAASRSRSSALPRLYTSDSFPLTLVSYQLLSARVSVRTFFGSVAGMPLHRRNHPAIPE